MRDPELNRSMPTWEVKYPGYEIHLFDNDWLMTNLSMAVMRKMYCDIL